MLVCECCDQASHMFCLPSPLESVPSGVWLCDDCVHCVSCHRSPLSTPFSSSSHPPLCEDCFALREKGNWCRVCDRVYRDDDEAPMVCCDVCQQWVHIECDHISPLLYQQMGVSHHSTKAQKQKTKRDLL